LRFLFGILKGLNNDTPTRWEVRYCLNLIDKYEDHVPLTSRIVRMMEEYAAGYDVENLRDIHLVPYERVRQCLIKGCRISYELEKK